MVYQVNGSRMEWNPSAAQSRDLTVKMPNASVTRFGNVNVKARVDSRSTRSTYLVEDSANSCGQTITRTEYERVAVLQDAHIAASPMVVVGGFIGSDPKFRTRARLIMKLVEGAIEWAEDPDFGYDVAAVGPGVDDMPGRRYGRPGPGR